MDTTMSFESRLANGMRTLCHVSRVRTCHGTLLSLDVAGRELSHREGPESSGETLAFRFGNRTDLALLVRTDRPWPDMPAAFGRAGWVPGLRPLSIVALDHEAVAFKPWGSACFLSAEHNTGRVPENRTAIYDWERFHFEPVQDFPTVEMRDFAALCAELCQSLGDPRGLLAVLLRFPPSFQPLMLALALDLVDERVRSSFVSLFTRRDGAGQDPVGGACRRLLDALPHGDWIAEALSALGEWEETRETRSIQRADARFDFFGFHENGLADSPYMQGGRLVSEARRRPEPRHALALLATARDEGLYLLEWIAHHRRIGVEQFFIYTNDLTDGSDHLLRLLAEAGEIVWIDNTGASPARINMQDKAYNHALNMVPELLDYRWCLVVDLDEVVLPSEHSDHMLPPLVAAREREGAEALAISWRVMTPNGHIEWQPGLSAERFVQTEHHPLIKSVFRTDRFTGAAAHHPTSRERRVVPFMTIDGEQHRTGDLTDHDINFIAQPTVNAMVCHYHVRSLEEYVWKFARGENDCNGVLTQKHFRYNNPGIFALFTERFSLGGTQPAAVLAGDIQREIRRLRSIPGVDAAVEEIETRFRAQSAAYVEQSDQLVQADDRIAPAVRARWSELVSLWRERRRSSL